MSADNAGKGGSRRLPSSPVRRAGVGGGGRAQAGAGQEGCSRMDQREC